MRRQGALLAGIGASIGMAILIFDARTAYQGASEGIDLCIRTVIPALFPFFVLSILLTGNLVGQSIPFLRPIGKLCGIPLGSESLLLVGLLGGYPVGAQNIAQAYELGQLSGSDARRMLSFCSNAGPAFIFGMISQLFPNLIITWCLWGIHIFSAIMVGIIFPGKSTAHIPMKKSAGITLSFSLERAIKVMAGVCGWVILFRIILSFLNRWFLWLLPETVQVIAAGLLELTNGCSGLNEIENLGLRFILCSGFLSIGGLCVTMQTVSVTGTLGIGQYVPGKITQTAISILAATLLQYILFQPEQQCMIPILILTVCVLVCGIMIFLRNNSRKMQQIGV